MDKRRKRMGKIQDRIERNAVKKMVKDGTLPDPKTSEPEPEPYDWRDDFKLGGD